MASVDDIYKMMYTDGAHNSTGDHLIGRSAYVAGGGRKRCVVGGGRRKMAGSQKRSSVKRAGRRRCAKGGRSLFRKK